MALNSWGLYIECGCRECLAVEPEDAPMQKGQLIVCTNGHVIGEVLEDVWPGRVNWHECFGHWRQDDVPKPGSMDKPVCAICSANFIKPDSWEFYLKDETP